MHIKLHDSRRQILKLANKILLQISQYKKVDDKEGRTEELLVSFITHKNQLKSLDTKQYSRKFDQFEKIELAVSYERVMKGDNVLTTSRELLEL